MRMSWHDFVFSTEPAKRLARHSVFWIAWFFYFFVCNYLYQQPAPYGLKSYYVTLGSHTFLKTAVVVLISAFACYCFMRALLPQVINGQLTHAAITTVLLSLSLFVAGWTIYWYLFPWMDSFMGASTPARVYTRFWPAVTIGLINPLKVVAAGGTIKYVKHWWLKNRESIQTEQEKINAEYQLLKAQVRPAFLLSALDSILVASETASPRAPGLLLKLSNLLSYLLYDCGEPLVSLQQEIDMIRDYVALENLRAKDLVDIEFNVEGDMEGKLIAPSLLLPIIEENLKQCDGDVEQPWINIDISFEADVFMMKLATGIADGGDAQHVPGDALGKVKNRLALMYPHMHELRVSTEREMLIVLMKIHLVEEDHKHFIANADS
jgi:hypothetical protein